MPCSSLNVSRGRRVLLIRVSCLIQVLERRGGAHAGKEAALWDLASDQQMTSNRISMTAQDGTALDGERSSKPSSER